MWSSFIEKTESPNLCWTMIMSKCKKRSIVPIYFPQILTCSIEDHSRRRKMEKWWSRGRNLGHTQGYGWHTLWLVLVNPTPKKQVTNEMTPNKCPLNLSALWENKKTKETDFQGLVNKNLKCLWSTFVILSVLMGQLRRDGRKIIIHPCSRIIFYVSSCTKIFQLL